MRPFASWPLGATLQDSARRKPSEIPSQTRSVSAFLPGQAPAGPRASGDLRSRQAPPPRCLEIQSVSVVMSLGRWIWVR